MTERRGVGQYYGWDGGCAFVGRHDRPLPIHAHHAMQLVVGSDGGHLVRTQDDGPWQRFELAAIGSQQPHGLDVTASACGAVIFIEPETREGRALAERLAGAGLAETGSGALRAIADAMFAARRPGGDAAVVTEARRLVAALVGSTAPSRVTDDRVLKAIAYIGSRLDRELTLDEVAAQVHLSPGRFRHLFVEETGMGLRPYLLWRRFLLVWTFRMEGRSLSEAAHAAGFADAAHMTRTSVRTFGFAPSSLQLEPLRDAPR